MIWALDGQGRVTFVGGEWEAFVLPDATKNLNERVFQNVHESDWPEVEATFRAARERCLPLNCVFRLRHRDGSWRRMLARGVPTISPTDGSLVGYLGTTYEMLPGDLSTTSVGWVAIRDIDRRHPKAHLDAIADHLLIARAFAEDSGETRLAAICDYALREIFAPYGLEPSARQ